MENNTYTYTYTNSIGIDKAKELAEYDDPAMIDEAEDIRQILRSEPLPAKEIHEKLSRIIELSKTIHTQVSNNNEEIDNILSHTNSEKLYYGEKATKIRNDLFSILDDVDKARVIINNISDIDTLAEEYNKNLDKLVKMAKISLLYWKLVEFNYDALEGNFLYRYTPVQELQTFETKEMETHEPEKHTATAYKFIKSYPKQGTYENLYYYADVAYCSEVYRYDHGYYKTDDEALDALEKAYNDIAARVKIPLSKPY